MSSTSTHVETVARPEGTSPRTSPHAVAGVVLAILWVFGLGSACAVALGLEGLVRTKAGQERGRGFALASVVLGALGLVLAVVVMAPFATSTPEVLAKFFAVLTS